METLEHLRRQLDSVDDLRGIVRTMKALSAASIRQYEQAAAALAGYHRTVQRGLYVVFNAGPPGLALRTKGGPHRVAAVVFGSDHGLCGRFNEEIAQHAAHHVRSLRSQAEDRAILAVGARVAVSLGHEGQTLDDTLLVPSAAAQITGTVQRVLLQIDDWTERAGVGEVHLSYNRRARGKGYRPTAVRLLPVDLERLRALGETRWPSRSLPTFTMDREVLLSRLLRQYLFVSVFRACAESLASEHASRLTAMQSAERNLDERLEEVTMRFRRARQNAITSELLDVVSGFEAATERDRP
jgi:F-type H+-transporting ATPase subunit gamma